MEIFQSASWKRHCKTHWREQRSMDTNLLLKKSISNETAQSHYLTEVSFRLILVQENYDQRAQVLTKDHKLTCEVGCTKQVCHLLLKESLFCFRSAPRWLKLNSKSTRCDHWNSLTYMENGCYQIIVTFR